jgi:hypothetical protein
MTEQNVVRKCLQILEHQAHTMKYGLRIGVVLGASIFALVCGLNKGTDAANSEAFRNASQAKLVYLATQTEAGSKKELAYALPQGLWEAILAEFQDKVGQVEIISHADLNGDKRGDAIVKILGDYSGSCGYTAAVFSKEPDGYRMISAISCVAEITVDEKRTNGWLDLLASSREGYFRLTFNGRSYPPSPLEGKRENRSTP